MIFGFLSENLKTQAVAVAFSMAWLAAGVEPDVEGDRVRARDRLADFREELYRCFTARADELFELAESVLCAGGPVRALAGLSLVPEHRRGHGALYDAVNQGRIEVARLRWSLAALARWADPAGRRCEQLAAAGRGHQPGADVLPRLWPGEGERADNPGLAVLGGRGAGTEPHLVDGAAGRGPARPR